MARLDEQVSFSVKRLATPPHITTTSLLNLETTKYPTQCESGYVSPGIKRSELESDQRL